MGNIQLGLLLFLTLFGTLLACSCVRPVSIEEKYCEADFAMVVKVKSDLNIPGEGPNPQSIDAFYKVKTIGKPWKLPNKVNFPKYTKLFTGSHGALCGVRLEKNAVYFVAGSYNDMKFRLNSCSSIILKPQDSSTYQQLKKQANRCRNTVTYG